MTLNKILGKNPFTDEVVSQWRNTCQQVREGRVSPEQVKFVLPNDADWILRYNSGDWNKRRRAPQDHRFIVNLLPQPFIGNPNAPIWLLMTNPGYSSRDEYDLLSVADQYKTKISNNCVFPNEELDELEWRQGILLDQLRLSETSGFYLLNERFDSLRLQNGNRLSGGGFDYWRRHLFGQPDCFLSWLLNDQNDMCGIASSNVFVLEMMPYHSEKFEREVLTQSGGRLNLSWASRDYARFWRMLIWYAIENGKIIITRSPNNVVQQLNAGDESNDIKDICKRVCGRFLTLMNPQGGGVNARGIGCYMPLKGLMLSGVDMGRIRENYEMTIRQLRTIFPKKWDIAWDVDNQG